MCVLECRGVGGGGNPWDSKGEDLGDGTRMGDQPSDGEENLRACLRRFSSVRPNFEDKLRNNLETIYDQS